MPNANAAHAVGRHERHESNGTLPQHRTRKHDYYATNTHSVPNTIGVDQFTLDGLLFRDSSIRFGDIRDGTSSTLLVGERPPERDYGYGWWYAGWGQSKDGSAEMLLGAREKITDPAYSHCPPQSNSFSPGRVADVCDVFHHWIFHQGGANFAFADGSVRFLKYSADSVLPALATRAGGESVPVPD